MRNAPQFRPKRPARTNHLADLLDPQQDMLFRRRPVDEKGLDPGPVEAPGKHIGLHDSVGRKPARHLASIDGKPVPGLAAARRKPARRQINRTRDNEVPVMLGKPDDRSVAPRHPPAMANRRRIALKMCCKPSRKHSHGLISTNGIDGIRPA